MCHHGGYYTCSDRYQPGHLLPHKWENCFTVQTESWGYDRRNTDLYQSVPELLEELVSTIAYGGNLLLNVGPTWDGRILQAFKDRLFALGAWLKVNGDAIYATKPWTVAQNQSSIDAYYTTKGPSVYATFLTWPVNNTLHFTAPVASPSTTVSMLGTPKPVKFTSVGGGITVTLPTLNPAELPSMYAWTLQFDGLSNR